MDWRTDANTWNIGDEFMFGPAILVNPVLKANATTRSVYLPAAQAWYDFWTGESLPGSQETEADAPLDRMPLFVRAGSIIPMGPEIEYATDDPDGAIEIRVYRAPTGTSTSTRTPVTATIISAANILLSPSDGMIATQC